MWRAARSEPAVITEARSARAGPAVVMAAEERTAAEVTQRFAERSLILCGSQFVAVKSEPAEAVPKLELLECVHSRVCEKVYERLQQCAKQDKGDPSTACAQHRRALSLCVQAAYSSLPEPDVPVSHVKRQIAALLGGSKGS